MKQPARVLMVGTNPESKGGISSVIRLYREAGLLTRVRYLASYTDGGPLKKLLFYLGFLFRYTTMLVWNPSIRLVHIHSASYGSFGRKSFVIMLARLFGRKTLVHIHGAEFNVFYDTSPPPFRWLIRKLLHDSDALIALSRQWKEDLFRISGNPDIRVIYNPAIMRDPVSGNGQNGQVNFLFMGRLGKRKGVYDIIESARRLRSNNVRISLYGDGEVENVRQMVQTHHVEETVSVCGWIDGLQKEQAFRAADVLLLPSYNEGLPISVLEAMAYGMPVVATDVGGIAEAVEDGVSGYLIQPGECERLAQCIERLADSPELRSRMGRSAHEIAARKFALSTIVCQLEALYDDLAGSD